MVAGAVTAIAFHFVLWLPWGMSNVWDQAYQYHLDVATERTPAANLRKVLSTLGDRDLLIVVAVVLMIGAIVFGRRARPPAPEPRLTSPDTLLIAVARRHGGGAPHRAPDVAPARLPADPGARAARRPAPPADALLLVRAGPRRAVPVVHAWPVLSPTGFTGSAERVVEELGALPDGALAISDDPGLVWRAGRLTPPDLVDASILRIQTGDLTSASIAAVAAEDDVCAVVVRSAERWGSFEDLPERLAAAGYDVADEDELGRRLYLKTDCTPGG